MILPSFRARDVAHAIRHGWGPDARRAREFVEAAKWATINTRHAETAGYLVSWITQVAVA